ncbi:LPS-assembly protein LptD [Gemmobacter serpentinus]|uniref:LPS-assembly protein LptD n=1 Tax=Gemmobacter serpentinus TaxID=2652247 RepID=UPI00124EC6F4|nr:LPS assembly protein LptD [Gemmobacter serpentinus]
MRLRHFVSTLLLTVALPLAAPLQAQDLASLQADQVAITGDQVLNATGAVEVRYRGQILRAQGVRYDKGTDRLSITGPITVTDGSGNLITADAAELSADLSEGLLTSARFVLARQMQIAARQMFRTQGRYTQLTDSVASSCEVCTVAPTPLWEIRAARVIHDEQERQLWFDKATLRFGGVPVAYIPRLRMPDPTLDRATGFLSPRLRTTSDLGAGIKLPYFIALGPSRDLTVTPYVSAQSGRSVELRYRQAFRTGTIEATGALSRDRILRGEDRGYVALKGDFGLPDGFRLTFSGLAVSDPGYLVDYDISDMDRIDSRIEASRTRRNEYVSGRFVNFRSIRDIGGQLESNATLPTLVADFTWHRRFSGGPLGGEAGLRFQTHSHYRSSDSWTDSDIDADDIADGRDLSRVSLRLDWRRSWVFGPGLVGTMMGEGNADIYSIRQDALYEGTIPRLHGTVGAELRWPWVATSDSGASHVIEPVLQLVAASSDTADVPNEDSTLVEFDEGNLYSMGRFSGSDAREAGTWLNAGVSWTRFDPAGWSSALTLGRVLRTTDEGQFSEVSGLAGSSSDWLAAGRITFPAGFSATGRVILDDGLDLTKGEMLVDINRERYGLSASYVWMQADAAESRTVNTNELHLDGRHSLGQSWTGRVSGRYDLEADRLNRANMGLEFRNECLRVDLSLSRRFTTSTSVKPTTNIGLSVDLLGFGGAAKAGPAGACRG